MSDTKPGFIAIYIDAHTLQANGEKFAIILEDNAVKCYGVSKSLWKKIEQNASAYLKAGSCKPLVCLNDEFRATAKQMNWAIVGEIEDD